MTLGIISRWRMRMTLSVISLGWGTQMTLGIISRWRMQMALGDIS